MQATAAVETMLRIPASRFQNQSAEQLSMLERQYLERRLLEQAGLPRLSLFYMR